MLFGGVVFGDYIDCCIGCEVGYCCEEDVYGVEFDVVDDVVVFV